MSDTAAAPQTANATNSVANVATGGALDKNGLGWAIFEWARNPYYILIVIYVFAPYFGGVVGASMAANGEFGDLQGRELEEAAGAAGQASIASITKMAGLIAAPTVPILGAMLDRGGRRKPLLIFLLGTIALMSWILWYAKPDGTGFSVPFIMGVLVIAYVTYTYSEVTHNAMLSANGAPRSLPVISGIGLALGNLAGMLILLFIVITFAMPALIGWPFEEALFGIDVSQAEHFRIAGPICAVWLVLFSIPFFVMSEDGGTKGASWIQALKDGIKSLIATFRRASDNKEILKYLGARMLYADAMAALLTLGGVFIGLYLQWNLVELSAYAIIGSLFAFFGGLLAGVLDRAVGPKRALILEVTGLLLVLTFQLSITPDTLFYGLVDSYQVWDGPIFNSLSDVVYLSSALVLAVVATASISSSRSMLVHMAPPERVGEFFGLYSIAGNVTVWLGPLMVEIFTRVSGDQRIGMSAIGVLFLLGLMVLMTVKAPYNKAEA